MDPIHILPEVWRFLSALAGGVTYSYFRPESTWRRNLSLAGIGTSVGLILTPWALEWLGWSGLHSGNAMSYVFSLLGVIACKSVITAGESSLTPDIFSNLIRKVFGPAQVPTPPDPGSPQRRTAPNPDSDIPVG